MTAATVRVRVTLAVDVDPEAWALAYGTDRAELRADVKAYVLTQLQGCAAADEGGIVDVAVVV